MNKTDELRTARIGTLLTPAALAQQHPISAAIAANVTAARQRIARILTGEDPRLLVIIGPCSLHDPKAALEYAERLNLLREQHKDRLEIVMRAYFEKPRTVVGWKGLISDPDLDGSFDVNRGIAIARQLLLDINAIGMPTATEFLDMVIGQFIADLISWGAIGARTTESQIHREMASALSCPVGFKNGTDGNVQIAGNIMINYAAPVSLGNIPNIIIEATGNIIIAPGVTQIDATLIAGGTLFTCGNTKPTTQGTCNNKLTINGPTKAKNYRFWRTNTDTSATSASEVFVFPPSAIMSPYGAASTGSKLSTDYELELPPRY